MTATQLSPEIDSGAASRPKSDSTAVPFRFQAWRAIPGWPEYEVSERGSVRRVACGVERAFARVLKPTINKKTRYLSVCLSRSGRVTRIDIHRLVAFAFLGAPPSPRHIVAHNDGRRGNNHYSNLRWATQKENLADCRKHGTAMLGSANPNAALDEIDVRAIRRMKQFGVPRPIMADGFGLHKRTVFQILSGERWGHV
jgi:hypothetical protein